MHDATECGVLGGLYEVAQVGDVGMRIRMDDIVFQDVIRKTCECFGIEPFSAISEGTLIATVKPAKADEVVGALKRDGIPASIAGEITPGEEGMVVEDGDGEHELRHPGVDPFWLRFEEYLKKQKP